MFYAQSTSTVISHTERGGGERKREKERERRRERERERETERDRDRERERVCVPFASNSRQCLFLVSAARNVGHRGQNWGQEGQR